MKLIKIFASLFVILALFALTACSGNNSEANAQAAQVQEASSNVAANEYSTTYNFTTQKLDGSALALDDYRGKVVIVDLWDTWCPPCRKEIPHFIELYSEYKDQGFVMIGLAFGQEGQKAVEEFVQEYGINYINGYVNQDVIDKFGQPRGIPTTYVIDQNGNVHNKYVGYRDKSVFEADIQALLGI
jgi:thiol-disulfide isomerase/thioredoxin